MSKRTPLKPAAGLSRSSEIPPPPPHRPRPPAAAESLSPSTASAAATPELPVPSPSEPVARPEPARRSKKPRRRVPAGSPASSVPLTMTLPVPLIERVRTEARASGKSHGDTVLTVVAEQRNRLPALVEKLQSTEQVGMFVMSGGRRDPEPLANLAISTSASNIQRLEELATECRARSLSQLVRAALVGKYGE